ncbi:DeoR/GlpR family DNA-binding transcription regulator [Brucella pituitosa]|uniref:DeoR/GlpR family DNA-binding transcription regulator n=1 Tax=Brucella pituitosa TaxID=571256 RepID=UPI000D011A66|nr:hypothetical protein CQ062_13000 [Ochrobactrum sp. MYb68]
MAQRPIRPSDRQDRIRDRLIRLGDATCAELADMFSVSEETIRRDLASLEEKGQAMRVHGGARAVTAKGLPHIDLRIGADREAKERIARLAHGMLKPGMSVFFSGGSTALATAWEARHEPPIIATSLMVDIMIVLAMGGQTDLTLCGGQFDKHSRASFGFEAMEIISRRVFDVAFMGASGFDVERGLLGPSDRHLQLAQVVRRQTRKFVVLASHTALQRSDKFSILPTSSIDLVITDQPPPSAVYAALERAGVEIIY